MTHTYTYIHIYPQGWNLCDENFGDRRPSHNVRQGIVQLRSVIHQSRVATF